MRCGLAIENKAIKPKLDYPVLRIVRFSGAALTEDIEEHFVETYSDRLIDQNSKAGQKPAGRLQ